MATIVLTNTNGWYTVVESDSPHYPVGRTWGGVDTHPHWNPYKREETELERINRENREAFSDVEDTYF